MANTRILIVDDVPQVREELRNLLKLQDGIEIIGEAGNGFEAISQVQALQPDVILMDLEMPVMDGYEATRQIKFLHPDCRVVALTIHGYAAACESAFQAGVDIFIEKGAPIETLMKAISIHKGESDE